MAAGTLEEQTFVLVMEDGAGSSEAVPDRPELTGAYFKRRLEGLPPDERLPFSAVQGAPEGAGSIEGPVVATCTIADSHEPDRDPARRPAREGIETVGVVDPRRVEPGELSP